jgi:hypothetical protein
MPKANSVVNSNYVQRSQQRHTIRYEPIKNYWRKVGFQFNTGELSNVDYLLKQYGWINTKHRDERSIEMGSVCKPCLLG